MPTCITCKQKRDDGITHVSYGIFEYFEVAKKPHFHCASCVEKAKSHFTKAELERTFIFR